MEKHCESGKRFGTEATATAARNEILQRFIEQWGDKVCARARLLAGNDSEARELVEDAFYRVIVAWDKYDQSRPFEAWFFVILRHLFISSRTRFSRRRFVSLDQPVSAEMDGSLETILPDGSQTVEQRLESVEAVKAVNHALARLRRTQRTILTLSDMQGLSYGEIARRLAIPLGTVRSRISRARQALRSHSPELAAFVA